MTWNPGVRPASRKKPVLLVLGVIALCIVVFVTVATLWYQNVIITTGPSRADVTRTAERIIHSDVPRLPGKPILGHTKPYYSPCGHGEIPPLSAYAGATVRILGIPASQHSSFEKALDDQTGPDLKALPSDQQWEAFVFWDSNKSSSGEVEVEVGCVPVARWP